MKALRTLRGGAAVMEKKYGFVSIGLLFLLGLRLGSHLEPMLVSQSFGAIAAFVLYLIPFIGVMKRRRWGATMSGIVGLLDLLMTIFYIGGSNMIGAAAVDGVLVLLSYLDYRQLTLKERTKVGAELA